MTENRRIVEVVAELIRDAEGLYLAGQRAAHKAQSGLWEFMGSGTMAVTLPWCEGFLRAQGVGLR